MQPSSPLLPSPKFRHHQILVFAITAFLYSTLHASRTAWAYSKASVSFDDQGLSILDTCFLSAYAIGLYLSGWLGDRVHLKTLLGAGMFATVAALVCFALMLGHFNYSSILLGSILNIISGFGQSTAFPACISIMSNWFSSSEKGLMFGVWLVNINLGNIMGQQIGRFTLDVLGLEWYKTILISAGLIFISTLLMCQFLRVHPSEVSGRVALPPKNFDAVWQLVNQDCNATIESPILQDTNLVLESKFEVAEPPRGIGFLEALMAPGVILYAVVFICVKSVLYGLLLWLPLYLRTDIKFQGDTAELLASLELGQLLGVITLGYISDKIKSRAQIISVSLFIVLIIFFCIDSLKSPDDKVMFTILLFLAGIFIGGPAGIISSSVSSELGGGKGEHGSSHVSATSTITGIIDGSGTIGAAATQLMMPLFRHSAFLYYAVVCFVACALTPFAHRQILRAKAGSEEKVIELPKDRSFETTVSSRSGSVANPIAEL